MKSKDDPDDEEDREGFVQGYVYNLLGDVSHIDYPECTLAKTCPAAQPRDLDFTYKNGGLTAIPGFLDSITYHANGLYSQITHANGVVDTQQNDANSMPRPGSLSAQHGLTDLWGSDTYSWDGAGNVTAMGGSWFYYDRLTRVKNAHVVDSNYAVGGNLRWQTYTYDPFGNLTDIESDEPQNARDTPVDPATNRSSGDNVLYDEAGNQTQGASPSGTCATGNPCYEYDQFHMMRRMRNSFKEWLYIYTADDERLWAYRNGPAVNPRPSIWTLRDLDGKVLREYELHLPNSPARDYVYRDGQLAASVYPGEGTRHMSLDHLGTPRLVTSSGGDVRTVATGGGGTCKPAPADYDGDGEMDLSLKCGAAWNFYNDDGSFLKVISTGGSDSDIPAPADYDGDGDDDVVAFNGGAWHFYDYDTGAYLPGSSVWTGTSPGCLPAPADYNGNVNHDAELSLKCPAGAWHFYNDNGTYLKGIWTGNSHFPVPGDYDGDGDADVVTFDGPSWNFFNYATGAYTGGVSTELGHPGADGRRWRRRHRHHRLQQRRLARLPVRRRLRTGVMDAARRHAGARQLRGGPHRRACHLQRRHLDPVQSSACLWHVTSTSRSARS